MNSIKLITSTFLNDKKTREELSVFIKKTEKLSMGIECEMYEKEFSKFQKTKYSVMFNSGSSANLALIQALKNLNIISNNQKIAFSAVTWSTSVMPIIQMGFKPIPVDINLNTLNCDSYNLLKTLKKNPDIKIFFITNILGLSSDIDKIKKICEKKNIILIEDNCESFGSEYKKKKLGNFGLASTCSNFVGHHLSTIEGGMVSTKDYKLYNMLKIVRAHGWSRNLDKKTQIKLRKENNISRFYDLYAFYDLGFNLRPTEISGFLGRRQLKYQRKNISVRNYNFNEFNKIIENKNNCILINNKNINLLSNMAFPILKKDSNDIKKNIDLFKENKVEIRPLVAGNITKQPFYLKYFKNQKINLPNADHVHQCGFYIPNNSELNRKEINKLKKLLEQI